VQNLIYDMRVVNEFDSLASTLVARDVIIEISGIFQRVRPCFSFVDVTHALKMEGVNSNIYSSR
jgi:hypothetical protein